MIKSTLEWFKELPYEASNKAINNTKANDHLRLHNAANSMSDALERAFNWSASPEGAIYWGEIARGNYQRQVSVSSIADEMKALEPKDRYRGLLSAGMNKDVDPFGFPSFQQLQHKWVENNRSKTFKPGIDPYDSRPYDGMRHLQSLDEVDRIKGYFMPMEMQESETSDKLKSYITEINNNILKKEKNEKLKGHTIKVQPTVATIRVGKRCSGSAIQGRRIRATIVSGHIGYKAVNSNS